jgi:hypothetical protein
MSGKTLANGQIKGLRCPYCPLVCQRISEPWGPLESTDRHRGGSLLDGLKAHVLTVHTDLYQIWAETFQGAE